MSVNEEIGQRMRMIRKLRGDSLSDLSKAIGMSESNFSKYERGERTITVELLQKVAKHYRISVADIFGEEGDLPEELKEQNGEWIAFNEEMKNKNITPDELKAIVNLYKKLNG